MTNRQMRGMNTIKPKSIFALILFSILTFGLASIATSAGTRITNNGFEDSFPKTAGGYVVWQGQDGNDWEIFLYNANDGSGPFPITDNTYPDINPETDGKYVTWVAGAALLGEIFLYNIETQETRRITDNTQLDHYPKIVDGIVVWVSHSDGVDALVGPGDIVLYDIAENDNAENVITHNISEPVDPGNINDDYAFRFDGNRIQWVQRIPPLGHMLTYVYDLATKKYYRYYTPDDDADNSVLPYLEDVETGAITYLTLEKGLDLQDDPQSDGDFSVSAPKIGGSDSEILLSDRQIKRGCQITANSIEDTQPVIKDNIVVWKGGKENRSEIYLYEIQPLFANAGYDFEMDIANVDQMVIRGKAGGGANEYRWLLGETALTDWLPVVDGQAPLDLANESGFAAGQQTLTLEVTDGITVLSDHLTMDLQDWPLELVSPADSSIQLQGIYPEFMWSSPSYKNFKIQISQTPGFRAAETVTYPSATDEWMIGTITSFTADDTTTQSLDNLLSASPIAYWRVVAMDCYENRKVSETGSFIIACLDDDSDGLCNNVETNTGIYSSETDTGTDPNKADTDNDGLSDGDEINFYSTDPNNSDTDNDGLNDGVEVEILDTNPLLIDSNSNGISDGDEDFDFDGFTNAEEVQCNSDPADATSRCKKALPWLLLLLN